MSILEVDVPYSNSNVFDFHQTLMPVRQSSFGTFRTMPGFRPTKSRYEETQKVKDWLDANVKGEWDSCLLAKNVIGRCFRFTLASDAMLFKMTFGGQ